MADLSAIVDELYEASAVGDFKKVEGHLTDDFFVEEAFFTFRWQIYWEISSQGVISGDD